MGFLNTNTNDSDRKTRKTSTSNEKFNTSLKVIIVAVCLNIQRNVKRTKFSYFAELSCEVSDAVRQKRNLGCVCAEVNTENILGISNFKTKRNRRRRTVKRRRRKTVATTETLFKFRREQGEEYGK
jgi:hypothetical protein